MSLWKPHKAGFHGMMLVVYSHWIFKESSCMNKLQLFRVRSHCVLHCNFFLVAYGYIDQNKQ